ncbi:MULTISPECIES: XRE family transcriptional regulator [unclassified Nocardiopsis]|uniref:XRE family transcriptional regulator n=1 Tax=Nocardiopsis TaxID=2013 RepID=UPI00387B9B07
MWALPELRQAWEGEDAAAVVRLVLWNSELSQMKLAQILGLSQSTISDAVSGRSKLKRKSTSDAVFNGLGILRPPDTPSPERCSGTAVTPARPSPFPGRSIQPVLKVDLFPGEESNVRRREFVGLAGTALFQASTGSLFDMDEIAAALTRYAGGDQGATHPATNLRELARRTRAAKAGYQACHYTEVAKRLPALLRGLDDAVTGVEGDEVARAHALRAEAYHVAASLLLKCEERGLSYLAADRSMRAAEASERPEVVGASARAFARALMRERHYKAATELATSIAERVDAEMDQPTPESLSVYGSLLLSGAVSAAKSEKRDQALGLLEEAEETGARLGGDFNYQWTAFGPTNVLLHRVSAAVEMGDAGNAIDYARQVRLENIEVMERRATLFIDVARAYQQWEKTEQAYQALRNVEDMASEELSARPVVHRLINDIRSRAGGNLYGDVSELAERVGA